jgi:ElaB/YqjD/DUF883 family membrane-anchored ribosome-binding protein
MTRNVSRAADMITDTATSRGTALADAAQDALDEGVGRARTLARAAGDWASDTADAVASTSGRGYRAAEDTLRAQPMLAVGVALVAGLLVGAWLFSRD